MPFPPGSSLIRLTQDYEYGASLTFYGRNGFGYLTSKDKGIDTRLMYFDLMKLVE